MRKTKLMLISLICILCAFGCGKNNQQTVDWVYLTPDKPQIKIEKAIDLSGSYEITEYDRNGNEIKFEMYDKYDHLKYSSISTYDDKGNLLTEYRESDNGRTTFEKNVYDKNGNLIKEYEGDNEDNLILDMEYEYDNGLLKKCVDYNEDGKYTLADYVGGWWMWLDKKSGVKSYFPAATRYDGGYAMLMGSMVGLWGNYWTNAASDEALTGGAAAFAFSLKDYNLEYQITVSPVSNGSRADAYSVRCIKE